MPRIFLHDAGYFILTFNSSGIINEIATNGPYMFAGKPVVMKTWSPSFDFQLEMNRVVPVLGEVPQFIAQLLG